MTGADTDLPIPMESPDRVASVALYVLRHPWTIFVERWNWKAALLSALFRGIAFAVPMVRLAGRDAVRVLCIEIVFRIVVSGFWGSLLQAFRGARPAWLASLSVAVVLPGLAHVLELAAFRAGHATHIRTGVIVSVVLSIGSLLVNLGLMRRGVLLTGGEGESLRSDLRRIPAALADMFRASFTKGLI